jgi:hypothetical protein
MLPARPCPSLRVLAIGATGFHFSLCRIGEQLAGPASSSSSPVPRGPCAWYARAAGPAGGCGSAGGEAYGRGIRRRPRLIFPSTVLSWPC